MRTIAFACLSAVFTVGLPSQSTHLVGSGGLPDIAAALAISAPGDRIHVAAGSYPAFVANVGVTIRAIDQGFVSIDGLQAGSLLMNIPQGQTLHLVGMQLGVPVSITGGRVTLDQCLYSGITTALTVTDAAVHLQNCSFVSGLSFTPLPTLLASNADITAVGSSFQCLQIVTTPVPAIDVTTTRLHFSGGSIRQQSLFAGPAIRAVAGSRVWVSDCNVQTGAPCPIESVGSTLRVSRSPGALSVSSSCASPLVGPPLLGVARSASLQPGSVFALTFRSEPNGFVAVFAGPELGTVDWGPILEQPSWLDEILSAPVALLLSDPSGESSASWLLPANPAIVDLSLWFKGISGPSLPLQASPVVGGIAR